MEFNADRCSKATKTFHCVLHEKMLQEFGSTFAVLSTLASPF